MPSSMTAARDRAAIKRWAIHFTTIGVLGTFVAQAAVPNAGAVNIHESFTSPWTQAAEKRAAKKKPRTAKPAETYPERQERIGESKRSLLKPLAENDGLDTQCVSGEFTTLSVVYDSIVESLADSLPASSRASVLQQGAAVKKSMAKIKVSTLGISEHPQTLGADLDDPQYRSPLSQLIVGNLLKIRDDRHAEAIEVQNLTLSQAVETAWLYFTVGVMAPLQTGVGLFRTVNFGDGVSSTVLTIASFGLSGGSMALGYLYSGISNAILNQCVARVTDEQKEQAGKPSDEPFDIEIHPLIDEAANQLALADSDTCPAVADQSLGRIVERTRNYLKAQHPKGSPVRRQIDGAVNDVVRSMKATPVPHNLIPADPADWNTAESLISTVTPIALGFGPQIAGILGQPEAGEALGIIAKIVGGTPLDIVIGLAHNIGQGNDMTETVSAYDLTVTKSLTAVYYSYALTLYIITTVGGGSDLTGGNLDPGLVDLGGGISHSPFSAIAILGNLPLTYGLITYHNVLRTMCFIEDDKTGTGLGAEANKRDPEAHAETVKELREQEKAERRRKAERAQQRGRPSRQSPTSSARPSSPRKTPAESTPSNRMRTGIDELDVILGKTQNSGR